MIPLILAILATYFIAHSIALEDGAFGVFTFVREHIDPEQKTWIGRGLNCPRCLGFWVALAVTLVLARQNPDIRDTEFLMYWIGIAGGSAALYSAVG